VQKYSITWVDNDILFESKNDKSKDKPIIFFGICGFSKRIFHVGFGRLISIQSVLINDGDCQFGEWCLDFDCECNKTTWDSYINKDQEINPYPEARASYDDPHVVFDKRRHSANNINGELQDYSEFVIDPNGDSFESSHVILSQEFKERTESVTINCLEKRDLEVLIAIAQSAIVDSLFPIRNTYICSNTNNYLARIEKLLREGNVIFIFGDPQENPHEIARQFYQEFFEDENNGHLAAISYLGDMVSKNGEERRNTHTIFYGQINERLFETFFGPDVERKAIDNPDHEFDDPTHLFMVALHKQFGQFSLTQVIFWKDFEHGIQKYLDQCRDELLTIQGRID